MKLQTIRFENSPAFHACCIAGILSIKISESLCVPGSEPQRHCRATVALLISLGRAVQEGRTDDAAWAFLALDEVYHPLLLRHTLKSPPAPTEGHQEGTSE